MKTREELERCRVPMPEEVRLALMAAGDTTLEPTWTEDQYGHYSTGMFQWKGKCIIITLAAGLWHLSASCNHTMGYYEMKELRYQFLPDAMNVAQIFPPRDRFVNVHENCFHLWQLAPGAYSEEL